MTSIQIEVFLADTRDHDCESLAVLLNRDAAARLAHITHPRRRAQFILGRILLIRALRVKFGSVADVWRLETEAEKPRITGAGAPEISLSHSGELVACAVAPVAIGLDVEYCRELDFISLAEQFCSPEQLHAFRRLPKAEMAEGFYRLWTLHEASFKLSGRFVSPMEDGGIRSHECFRPSENFMGSIIADTRNPIRLILRSAHPSLVEFDVIRA